MRRGDEWRRDWEDARDIAEMAASGFRRWDDVAREMGWRRTAEDVRRLAHYYDIRLCPSGKGAAA